MQHKCILYNSYLDRFTFYSRNKAMDFITYQQPNMHFRDCACIHVSMRVGANAPVYMCACICVCVRACAWLVDPISLCIRLTLPVSQFRESVCIQLMCEARQHHPSAEQCEANLMRMERKSEFSTLILEAHTHTEKETHYTP